MEPTNPIAFVRYYNAWRVGGDMDQPEPSKITRMLTELCDHTERLERELASKDAHADEIYKASVDLAAKLEDDLAAERALADRLAESIEWYRLNAGDCNKGGDDGALARDALSKDIGRNATKALAAWKEARNDT